MTTVDFENTKYSKISQWFSACSEAVDIKDDGGGPSYFNYRLGSLGSHQLLRSCKDVKEIQGKQTIMLHYHDHDTGHRPNFYQKLSFNLTKGAELDLILLNSGKIDHCFLDLKLHLSADSQVNFWHFGMTTQKGLVKVSAHLTQRGARFNAKSLTLSQDHNFSEVNTLVHHEAPDTFSHQLIKNILFDTSHGVFSGKIIINPHCIGVNAKQLHRSLLVNKKAHVHSEPQLEIYADDVKCSHGSSTSALSDDEFFYLQSRGIDPKKAYSILAWAFAQEMTHEIPDKTQQNLVLNQLNSYLSQMRLGHEVN